MYWLFFLLSLGCEVLGTIGGFGSSVFFVPLARIFFSAQLVLGLTGFFHVFSNLAKLSFFYRHIQFRLALRFGLPSALFAVVGALLAVYVSPLYADGLLSLFLLILSAWLMIRAEWRVSQTATTLVAGGSIAGFLAGFTGTGGAVRGLALTAFRLEQSAFVATSAAIDMGVDVSRTVVYLQHDFVRWSDWPWLLILVAVSLLGTWLGKWVLQKIKPELFYRLVLTLIFLVGLVTLVRFISGLANMQFFF